MCMSYVYLDYADYTFQEYVFRKVCITVEHINGIFKIKTNNCVHRNMVNVKL